MRAKSAAGGLHVECDAHEAHQRHQQPGLHRRERDDRSGGDHVGAAGDQIARDQVDDRGNARHEHLDDREEALAAHGPPHLQTHLIDVLGAVAGRLGALPIERLRQQDARDAQRLLGDGGQLRERLLRLARDPRAHLADPALHDHEDRHHHHGDQRESPVDDDHRDERRDHRHDIAQDARHGVREDAGDSAHIVLQTRLDDTGLGAREEAELHRLQVFEQLDPQVAGHSVADRRGEPRLHDAEAGRQDEQPDHDQDQAQQESEVGRAAVDREERLIEDLLDDQRRHHGDGGAGDHEHAGDEDLEAVGAEQRDHPPAEVRDARRLGIELLLGVDVDGAESSAATAPAAHAHVRKPTFGSGRAGRRSCPRNRASAATASRQPRSITRFTTVPMMTAPNRYASSDCAITSRRISLVRTALSPT